MLKGGGGGGGEGGGGGGERNRCEARQRWEERIGRESGTGCEMQEPAG